MSAEVELLRRAALQMCEQAGAVPSPPWTTGDDGLVWGDGPGDPVCGTQHPEDARYIASWDPAVALAVADWLDRIAEDHRGIESVDMERGECVVNLLDAGYRVRTSANHILPALAVARAYLGEVSDA